MLTNTSNQKNSVRADTFCFHGQVLLLRLHLFLPSGHSFICSHVKLLSRSSVSPRKEIKSSMKVIQNEGVDPSHVDLPMAAQIVLHPGSKISFIETFDKPKREIFLEGEAFFEVAHDVNRPFFVYTNEVTTKVLGTSFTIRALPQDKNITVAVKTGKVSVYTHQDVSKKRSKPSETILTPNQQIVYNREENKVSRMLVSVPQIIKPKEEVRRLRFEEASVSLKYLQRSKKFTV